MTKIGEMKPTEFDLNYKYIEDLWELYRLSRVQALGRISSYIFILNSGALLASLTYISTKHSNCLINLAISLFALGVITCIAHATIDYYYCERLYFKFKKNVGLFLNSKMEWEDLTGDARQNSRAIDFVLHGLGWTGGIVFIIGLLIGLTQIFTIT